MFPGLIGHDSANLGAPEDVPATTAEGTRTMTVREDHGAGLVLGTIVVGTAIGATAAGGKGAFFGGLLGLLTGVVIAPRTITVNTVDGTL